MLLYCLCGFFTDGGRRPCRKVTNNVISPNACSAARSAGPPSRCRRRCCSAARFPPPRPSLNRRTHFRFPAQSRYALAAAVRGRRHSRAAGVHAYPAEAGGRRFSQRGTDRQADARVAGGAEKAGAGANARRRPSRRTSLPNPSSRRSRKPPTSRPRASRANARSAARTGSFTTGRTGTNTKTSPTAIKPSAAMAAGRPIWR